MEAEGLSLKLFLNKIKKLSRQGKIQLGTFLKALEDNYPTLNGKDRQHLVQAPDLI